VHRPRSVLAGAQLASVSRQSARLFQPARFYPQLSGLRLCATAGPGIHWRRLHTLLFYFWARRYFPWNPLVWLGTAAVILWVWHILRRPRSQLGSHFSFVLIVLTVTGALFCFIVCGLILQASAIVRRCGKGIVHRPILLSGARTRRWRPLRQPLENLRGRRVVIHAVGRHPRLLCRPRRDVELCLCSAVRELAAKSRAMCSRGMWLSLKSLCRVDLYFRQIDPTTPLFTTANITMAT